MYQHCIFCSGKLGSNDVLEAFPVGRSIAFDAERGRLWAVCPGCARWNLAPLEERWEAVEGAERLFRDARLRVHSENVGLARLRDGTRLIRIGQALPGELAAWRYGRQMVSRGRKYRVLAGAGMVSTLMTWVGPAIGGVVLAVPFLLSPVLLYHHMRSEWRRTEPILDRVPAGDLPRQPGFLLRVAHLSTARLGVAPGDGSLELEVHDAYVERAFSRSRRGETGRTVILPDAAARRVLRRGLVHLNRHGASDRRVGTAVDVLAERGGAVAYLHDVAQSRTYLRALSSAGSGIFAQAAEGSLALEMALHEEEERRALAGELALLTSAWREAEEIARIADSLPGPSAA